MGSVIRRDVCDVIGGQGVLDIVIEYANRIGRDTTFVPRGFHVFFSDCVQNGFIWDVKTLKQFHEIFELRLGDIAETDCIYMC
jgi:hypothetical protein